MAKVNVEVGDTVKVARWDTDLRDWVKSEGVVEEIRIVNPRRREVRIGKGWWVVRNEVNVKFQIVKKKDQQ